MSRGVTPPDRRFGWIPPKERTPEQRKLVEAHLSEIPDFFLVNQTESTSGKRVCLWGATRDPRAKVPHGNAPILRQEEGSCVEQGKINAMMYLMAIEILRGDREQWIMPQLCHGYAWTRYYSGMRTRGHGAFGSGAAKAAKEAGICPVGVARLPDPKCTSHGVYRVCTWGSENETRYSVYTAVPGDANEKGKKHPVRSTAKVTTYEQVRDALANGYPVTVASMQGFQMRPRVDRGKHWGIPSGQWAHQMCFIAVDDDPSRPGCYCQNSWGATAHGNPADDAPPGGFWVDAEIVARMVRQGDSFAYSQFDGFPDQSGELDFLLV